jgi:hypothetical protein
VRLISFNRRSRSEIKDLLRSIFDTHESIIIAAFDNFNPQRMPVAPAADDELLLSCFHCEKKEELTPFHGVKICSICSAVLCVADDGPISKERVIKYFSLTRTETERITRKEMTGVMASGNVYMSGYSYKLSHAVKACEQKYGSLYKMAVKHREKSKGDISRPKVDMPRISSDWDRLQLHNVDTP